MAMTSVSDGIESRESPAAKTFGTGHVRTTGDVTWSAGSIAAPGGWTNEGTMEIRLLPGRIRSFAGGPFTNEGTVRVVNDDVDAGIAAVTFAPDAPFEHVLDAKLEGLCDTTEHGE